MPHPNDPASLFEAQYPQLAAVARGEARFDSLELLWHADAAAEREGLLLVAQVAQLQQFGLMTDELRRARGLLSQLGEIGLAIGETLDEGLQAEPEPEPVPEPSREEAEATPSPPNAEHFEHPVVEGPAK